MMFVKIKSPDNTEFAVNADHVRAIQKVTDSRSNILFREGDRTIAVSIGMDDLLGMFNQAKAPARTRRTPTSE